MNAMTSTPMTPERFIATWKDNPATERAGAQAHFDDLCDLLGVEKPRDPDTYCFERGAKKAGGGDGWADVWKRGHFGWENKRPGSDLAAALKQLTDYALHLENPPLLVVSDRERIVVHTAFTGYPDQPREIRIEELADPETRQLLALVFTDPQRLRPEKSTAAITAEVAAGFSALSLAMRGRGIEGQQAAHFLVQCLFCMFAEDEGLLPRGVFTGILDHAGSDPDRARGRIIKLFSAMRDKGGEYGDHDIPWFNGGLFAVIEPPELAASDLAALSQAARMDWRAIDPTIFGTLFERSLDPAARAPLGAHYTDPATIAKIIEPLITRPLLAEWEEVKAKIARLSGKRQRDAWQGFLHRLQSFRVLDPACGSGNFLYLALAALREVERRVWREGRELAGFQQELWLRTGPHNILGIEINEYAAELARVTVWIGDLQWCRRNGREVARDPILRPLAGIEQRDALLHADGTEASWPAADVILGNPPFLGDKMMRGELGDDYVETLRRCYQGRVPGGADLVTYWFEKARAQIGAGKARGAGLVATNSIRGGTNRKVLERIVETTRIFEAWSDEPWINEGAAVRVSLVCFGQGKGTELDGQSVAAIHADLTAGEGLDCTRAKALAENSSTSFIGGMKKGAFDIPGEQARALLKESGNPNGRPNMEVLFPWINGLDITRRPMDTWIIDFGVARSLMESSCYQMPFEHVLKYVKPARDAVKNQLERTHWWRHARPAPDLRQAIQGLPRFICTARVAKHRLFVWTKPPVICDGQVVIIARSDDTTFGILHSRFHELWSLRMCTWLGKGNDPRYTPTTTFETFPFPPGLTPADTRPRGDAEEPGDGTPGGDGVTSAAPFSNPLPAAVSDPACRSHAEAIARAAFRLNQLRENWLNPPEWVEWVQTVEEEQAGFPKRPVAKPGHEADLKKRTLTNLYNSRPAWLQHAHQELDLAVAQAYGWHDYTPAMADTEILARLLALNLERSGDNL